MSNSHDFKTIALLLAMGKYDEAIAISSEMRGDFGNGDNSERFPRSFKTPVTRDGIYEIVGSIRHGAGILAVGSGWFDGGHTIDLRIFAEHSKSSELGYFIKLVGIMVYTKIEENNDK